MQIAFYIIAGIIVVSALATAWLGKLIHSALCLALTFAGVAAMYLLLGAEFIGFAQILVYVGAVAVLIVFAILLTRNDDAPPAGRAFHLSGLVGVTIAALVFICLMMAGLSSSLVRTGAAASAGAVPAMSVKGMGEQLMSTAIIPLEILGLLLTVAMIGAVIIAMAEKRGDS